MPLVDDLIIYRESRRSVTFSLLDCGTLKVRAPRQLPDGAISCLITQKQRWITRQRHALRAGYAMRWPTHIQANDWVYLNGARHGIVIQDAPHFSLYWHANTVRIKRPASCDTHALTHAVVAALKKEAFNVIYPLCKYYCAQLAVSFSACRLSTAKRQWGSCTSKQALHFNWHLIRSPEAVLRYVVVHECCHLRHMNHSQDFWTTVESLLPSYQTHHRWLKKNGASLLLSR